MDRWQRDVRAVAEALPDAKILSGRRVLVTGATGLIGAAAVDLLSAVDARVIRAGRREAVYFDALASEGIPDAEAEYILHLAGRSDPDAIVADPSGTLLMSVNGTKRLLSAARQWNARMVYVSSSEIYGLSVTGSPWREDDRGIVEPLTARTSYAAGKRAAETLCVSAYSQYGAQVMIARPGHIYGPTASERDSHAAATFLRAAVEGKPIVMKSAGTQTRSWCHCLDCAAALIALLTRGEAGQAYNVAHPEGTATLRRFAERIAEAGEIPIVMAEASKAERAAFNPMDCSALNAEKLMGIGWRGSYPLNEGIKESLAVMRERRNGEERFVE